MKTIFLNVQEKHHKKRTLSGGYLKLLNKFENKYLFEFYD